MRLLEAILDANHRAPSADRKIELSADAFADALPLALLTCIDPRLNHRFPELLGVPEDRLIWLRTAGNIITGPLSSTTRSLALGCAIKGGKEIAIIGHTDCLVGKTSTLQLTDRLRDQGVDRTRLPENLNEFFGLFASERQNVLKAAEFVRQSPLIGANTPVHGLLLDLQTNRLEWVVNGYQRFVTSTSPAPQSAPTPSTLGLDIKIGESPVMGATVQLGRFDLGDMKFPEVQIGDASIKAESFSPKPTPKAVPVESHTAEPETPAAESPAEAEPSLSLDQLIDLARRYRVIGSDLKKYGPITGAKLLQWLAEGRIDAQTPAQFEEGHEWKPLVMLVKQALKGRRRTPPPLPQEQKIIPPWKRFGKQ